MKLLRSHREMRRAEARTVGVFFAWMALTWVLCVAILAGHYVLGWW